MEKSKFFEREINLIQSEDYRMFVKYYLDNYCPDYFWEIGASSSGKYHPKFSQGQGGLVRHTKAVVMFAEELLRMSSYMYMSDEHKDYVIMACILHDTCKLGIEMEGKYTVHEHPQLAKQLIHNVLGECEFSDVVGNLVESHMGQWNTCKWSSIELPEPITVPQQFVHICDYLASRKFLEVNFGENEI